MTWGHRIMSNGNKARKKSGGQGRHGWGTERGGWTRRLLHMNAMRMGFGLNVGNSKISIWESNIAVGRHENDFFSLKQTFMIWLIIIFIMLML